MELNTVRSSLLCLFIPIECSMECTVYTASPLLLKCSRVISSFLMVYHWTLNCIGPSLKGLHLHTSETTDINCCNPHLPRKRDVLRIQQQLSSYAFKMKIKYITKKRFLILCTIWHARLRYGYCYRNQYSSTRVSYSAIVVNSVRRKVALILLLRPQRILLKQGSDEQDGWRQQVRD